MDDFRGEAIELLVFLAGGDVIEVLEDLAGDFEGELSLLIMFSAKGFRLGTACPEFASFWSIFSCLARARSSIRCGEVGICDIKR